MVYGCDLFGKRLQEACVCRDLQSGKRLLGPATTLFEPHSRASATKGADPDVMVATATSGPQTRI